MLTCLKINGNWLKYASEELRANREIVLTAVKQTGTSLYYAEKSMRADREIMLAAVNMISRSERN